MRLAPLPLLAATLLATAAPLAAQRATLESGPMVGYSEMREVMLWARTTAPARVRITYWDSLAPSERHRTDEVATTADGMLVAKLVADRVEPGRVYHYEVSVDGAPVRRPWPLRFQTQALWQWRTDPPPFRFAIGSCAYANEPAFDRPGTPYGSGYGIFDAIHARRPDFMVWLGDNVYLREADWYSRRGIVHRYAHARALPELQPLLGSTHHYATWDDHDFGPNDADRSWREKDLTTLTFERFWANPGGRPVGGVATMFQWADVEVYLLDDRSFRSPQFVDRPRREMLGRAQVDWLVEALSSSRAPFKFVAVGSQVLTPVAAFETYSQFPDERAELLRRLADERIDGVVFLTGDRHFTELTRLERPGTYPLYDLTVSPLTAGVNARGGEEPNTGRVAGTVVTQHNFAMLEVTGPRTDRALTITVHDRDGGALWTRTLRARELQTPR